MWGGLSGGCRTGLALKKYNQANVSMIHLVGGDAAAVWLVKDDVHQVRLFLASIWSPSGGGGTREATDTDVEKPVMVQQHAQAYRGMLFRVGNAPDSASAEGSSIVDEPGKCGTLVCKNQRRGPGGF